MPMSYEEFKRKLAEQGGALPSAWSGPDVQTPQQITGDFAEKFANRPPLEEMVPWADPVKRGVATPEMVAEQGQRDELMRNAEFRPINNREKKLINLARLLNWVESTGHEKVKGHDFAIRHLKKISDVQKNAKARGTDIGDMLAEKIEKDFPPESWTPQIEANLPRNTKESVYPVSYQFPMDVREHNQRIRNNIEDNVRNIILEDFETIGYPQEMIKYVNRKNLRDIGEERFGLHEWDKINELLSRKKPDHVYHKTTKEKLGSIAEKGLTTPENLPVAEINWPKFPEQQDKVFFADRYDTGVGMNVPGSHTVLRTKFSEEMNPDIHTPRGWGWYQTKNPIPPQALEIESAPGVWEPLIEYLKKGKK